jgi:hypothetical protein
MGGWFDETFRAWNVASGETILKSTKAGDDNGVWAVITSFVGVPLLVRLGVLVRAAAKRVRTRVG